MLKKLVKYNNRPIARIILPLYLILICTTFITAIVCKVNATYSVIGILKSMSIVVYVITILGMVFGAFIAIILHFYQSSICDQAYFTYSIPTSIHKHIISKTVVGSFWMILSGIVCCASIFIVCACDKLSIFTIQSKEEFEVFAKQCEQELSISLPTLIILLVLVLIAAIIREMLSAQFCFAGGQLFREHKILGSILMYIVLTMVNQFVFLIPAASFLFRFGLEMSMYELMITIGISFIISYIVTVVATYGLTKYFLTKKLNIE